MTTFRVALLQLRSCGLDQAANLVRGEQACREAAGLGADLALFPEMWNVGYAGPDAYPSAEAWAEAAVTSDSQFVRRFASLAEELDLAIAITYLEAWPGGPRNTVSVFDRHGRLALTYAKVHTCDFDWESHLTPGDGFDVATLATRVGPVRVGAMICYDREFPESARVLMLEGAEIVLVPNACDMEDNRTLQLRSRAMENMMGIALANYAAPEQDGHSVAFDAVAFEGGDEDTDGVSVDPTLLRAGGEEGVFVVSFDLDRIRDYRRREAWGDAYRKPSRYGALVAPKAREPFIRPDARR
jgi:predicted amidohydrolase